jgi:hypothetical protein
MSSHSLLDEHIMAESKGVSEVGKGSVATQLLEDM